MPPRPLWFRWGDGGKIHNAETSEQLYRLLHQQMCDWLNRELFQHASLSISVPKYEGDKVKDMIIGAVTGVGLQPEVFWMDAERPSFFILASNRETGTTEHLFQVYRMDLDRTYKVIFSPLGLSLRNHFEEDTDYAKNPRKNYSFSTTALRREVCAYLPTCLADLDWWVEACLENKANSYKHVFVKTDSFHVLWKYAGDCVENAGFECYVSECLKNDLGMVEARKNGHLIGKFLFEWINGMGNYSYFRATFKKYGDSPSTMQCSACGRSIEIK
jgi:hypothetical protein